MDKETLSQYGWVVIVIIVLIIMIALATPFGSYVAKAAKSSVIAFSDKTEDIFDKNDINYDSPEFADIPMLDGTETVNLTNEEIENNELIEPIGATVPTFVLAIYNEDKTAINIVKNGDDSDGLIKENPFNLDLDNFDEAVGANNTVTSVVIGKGVKNTGLYAFAGFYALESVTIAKTVETIDAASFAITPALRNISLPKGLISIDDAAFQMSGLKSITIPNTVTSLGVSAFMACESLESITLSNHLTEIKDDTFRYTKLKNIVIPTSVTTIGGDAFIFNDGVCESVKIPASVTSIGHQQFGAGCKIYVKHNSFAEEWAAGQNYDYTIVNY